MKFHGLKKVTLIDYPGHIACTAFTHGCTLRCPFCHNPELVIHEDPEMDTIDTNELLEFLGKRSEKLDGIVFTGGEPLLHSKKLIPLLDRVHAAGLLVKIDTNGTFPKELTEIINEGLVDFVAMDFKTEPSEYSVMKASSAQIQSILTSLEILKSGPVEYEIRTTLVPGIHTPKTLNAMMQFLIDVPSYVLQNFEPNGTIDPDYQDTDSFSPEELEEFLQVARKHNPRTRLRGQ